MSYILFSPVGTTDPITQNHDGALLHISRQYRPEAVYLFYTAEMMSYREKDHRYAQSLKALGESLHHSFEIHEILRPELVEVQRFDDFYRDFCSILQKIHEEHPEAQILLNVSSGTPAIKSALQTIAALSQGIYLPIQVSSPNKKSNPKVESLKDYCMEDEWILNLDNEDNVQNRTAISSSLNLIGEIRREIAKEHIKVFDYAAALAVAKEIADISPDALRLLEIAVQRIQLDISAVDRLQRNTDFDVIPVKDNEARSICEYLLWLQIKKERQEYADFIRGITPVILDLCEYYLEKVCRFDWKRYCKKTQKYISTPDLTGKAHSTKYEIYRLTRNRLNKDDKGKAILQELDKMPQHHGGYRDTPFSSHQAVVLIEILSGKNDPTAVKIFNTLRDVESAVRNLAAHEIISITDDWIYKRLGFHAEGIWNLLRKAAGKTIQVPKTFWNSYQDMNQQIEYLLMK